MQIALIMDREHVFFSRATRWTIKTQVRCPSSPTGDKQWSKKMRQRKRRRRERQWEEAENGRRQNVYLNVFLIKCLLLLWKTILLFVKDKSKWKIEIIEAKVPCLPVPFSLSLRLSAFSILIRILLMYLAVFLASFLAGISHSSLQMPQSIL